MKTEVENWTAEFKPTGRLRRAGAIAIVLCVVSGGVLGTAAAAQGATVLRGVSVAGVEVAGMEGPRLMSQLAPAARVAEERPLTLSVGERSWTRRPVDLGIRVDVALTAERALRAGRENPLRWILQTLSGDEVNVPWALRIDPAQLRSGIAEISDLVRIEAVNGEVVFEGKEVVVKPPTIGVALVTEAARNLILRSVRRPPRETKLALPVTITPPPIGEDEVARVEGRAREMLGEPTEFVLEGKVITVAPEQVAKTLLVRVGQNPEVDDKDHLLLEVDPKSLEEEIILAAPWAATPPKDASFAVEADKARVIASAEGRSVDTTAPSEKLLRFGFGEERVPIDIHFKPVPPEFSTESARALGIQERISTFTTNFDPAN
ncbi:MAG: peptidoglycan binding domain-containing protein, partial [Acidimicrobiia bacterium]